MHAHGLPRSLNRRGVLRCKAFNMAEQFVQVPYSTFLLMERAAKVWLNEKKDKSLSWLDARAFGKLTGKTKEQLRYLREQHPELIKPKPGSSTQYLYNIKAYEKMLEA